MQRSKTHFEQIPVEMVKRIAKQIPVDYPIEDESASVETRDEGMPAQGDRREVAQRVQKEQDPKRMIGLCRSTQSIDKEKLRGRMPPTRESGSSDT